MRPGEGGWIEQARFDWKPPWFIILVIRLLDSFGYRAIAFIGFPAVQYRRLCKASVKFFSSDLYLFILFQSLQSVVLCKTLVVKLS